MPLSASLRPTATDPSRERISKLWTLAPGLPGVLSFNPLTVENRVGPLEVLAVDGASVLLPRSDHVEYCLTAYLMHCQLAMPGVSAGSMGLMWTVTISRSLYC